MTRIVRLAKATFIISMILAATPLGAMTELPLRFQRLMLADGLSQSSILSVYQDSRGFVWLGTQDGLNRYDGRQIRSFKTDPENPNSISDVNIWCITEDQNGDLWIGTEGGGFNHFDRRTEKFTSYQKSPDSPGHKDFYDVRSILVDNDGQVWVGTMGDGLLKFDPVAQTIISYVHVEDDPESLPANEVRCLLQDPTGTLWVGTREGLTRLDPQTGAMQHFYSDPLDECTLPRGEVRALEMSPRGGIWVGTTGGLGYLNPGEGRFDQYFLDPGETGVPLRISISSVWETPGDHLWIGSEHNGAYHLDLSAGNCRAFLNNPQDPTSLSDNEIYSLMLDRTGVLWIGSSNGANRLDTKAKQFYHISNQGDAPALLSNACVWSMWETRNRDIWIVTESGLNILNPLTGITTQLFADPNDPSLPSYNSFIEVVEDSLGGIWLGARDGALNRFDPETGLFKRFPPHPSNPSSIGDDRVFSICSDRQSGVWIGTMTGLERYDLATGQFKRYQHDPEDPAGITAGSIRELYLDSQDRLWMSIWGDGAASLDLKTGLFRHYRHDQVDGRSLSSNLVLSINTDSRGRVWVGTTTGLNLLDPDTGYCRRYSRRDGLPNNTIYRIEEDRAGRLWVATNYGLARFDPDSGEINSYVERDGIQDNEFNMGASHLGRSGMMYFGGINGLTAFYPEEIRSNPFVPQLALTDFRIFNKPVPLGAGTDGRIILDKAISETDRIELNHTDHVISFEFSVLHFASPLKNNYSYIMEGFETQWNEVGTRNHANYTNLPPGNYTFRVKGSNNDGVWNEEGVAVAIHVTPPFYRKAWFVFAVLFTIAGATYGAHRYRMRLLDFKNKRLETRVTERTKDLTFANEALEQEIAVRQQVEDELRLARNNAVAATQAKSEFLANMSHEIRTPMNGVLGMTSILLDTELSANQREFAEAINSSAHNLLIIINDILDFSKIEAGQLSLEIIEFDLFDVLDRITEMLGFKAQEKGLRFSCEIDPEVPRFFRGDPGRVTQILINLANNAVKFTSKGRVRIQVSCQGLKVDAADLVFAVSDTGVGIPTNRLDKIFDSFTQVDTSVTRKFGGTGLGLSIVRQLTELMGGEVWAESLEGQGATFHFAITLPVVDHSVQDGRIGKALVISGGCKTCTTLIRQLDYLGCTCESANPAEAPSVFARATACSEPFEWVFFADDGDRQDVPSLLHQLRNLQGDNGFQAILLGRLGKAINEKELQDLGLDAFLTMPSHHSKLEILLKGNEPQEHWLADQPVHSGPRKVIFTSGEPSSGSQKKIEKGPLILLAEDNPINQRVASLMLKKQGYRVDVVANGLEVLDALAKQDYAALLLDVQMPELDGLATARRIRAADSTARNPAIPIIALTAHAMTQDRQRSLAAGMDEHVAKPIDGETIARVLESFIGKSAPAVVDS